MPRTAQPAQPGTDPTPKPLTVDTATTAEELELVGEIDTQSELARLRAENAEIKAVVNALAKNQTATMPQPAVALPTYAEAMKRNAQVPVLTEEGWVVPAIHPTDRVAKV